LPIVERFYVIYLLTTYQEAVVKKLIINIILKSDFKMPDPSRGDRIVFINGLFL
jgi:hypothetical protein